MKLNESQQILKNILKESDNKYYYITDANEVKDYGGVYNSMANTQVINILDELKRYFNEGYTDAENTIKNAKWDPGIGKEDLELLKYSSEKIQEIIDKWNSMGD